jgi:hypothetical protein
MFHVPEQYRITTGPLASTTAQGNNGAFMVPILLSGCIAGVIASDGEGWEHVSVSFQCRTPLWEEMRAIKDVFWDPEDCVIQYHPPRSEYVNNHPHCLHLWRPVNGDIIRPPRIMV